MKRDTYYPDNLIAGNEYPSYARVQVIKQGGEYKRGTLLGKDGDDKFLLSIATADDGSEEPRGILAEDVDTTDGDVIALVYESGILLYLEMDIQKIVFNIYHICKISK